MPGSRFSYFDAGIGVHFTPESLSTLVQFRYPFCSVTLLAGPSKCENTELGTDLGQTRD